MPTERDAAGGGRVVDLILTEDGLGAGVGISLAAVMVACLRVGWAVALPRLRLGRAVRFRRDGSAVRAGVR